MFRGLGSRKDEAALGMVPVLIITQPVIDAFVHEKKQLLLAFCFEGVHLIQEQHPSIGQIQQPRPVFVSPGKGAFAIAEEIRSQQLRIIGIFAAVDGNHVTVFRN